ncbi:hypothetical protein V6Z12_A13G263700 [Gossypium hirsutum]
MKPSTMVEDEQVFHSSGKGFPINHGREICHCHFGETMARANLGCRAC